MEKMTQGTKNIEELENRAEWFRTFSVGEIHHIDLNHPREIDSLYTSVHRFNRNDAKECGYKITGQYDSAGLHAVFKAIPFAP